jgi:acetoin utilization deacetylase AcuC-like enzyme
MRKTGLLYDERFLLHRTDSGHPECSDRLATAYRALEEAGLLPHLTMIQATPARLKWIERVHSPKHIFRFEEACMLELGELDHADNQICKESYDTALLAVGGILKTIDLLMEGSIDNAFCAVRPPGHHAETNRALGFCYFNNVAIAAKYLQEQWQIRRVGIVDFDAHHGNGTQQIFFDDPTVFYYSIHEHPSFSFPGTGREFERGLEEGYGFTLNSPVLPGEGDEAYKELMQRDLFPSFASFKPEFILVSAGFDAHMDDDMSNINLSTEGFSWIMHNLVELAESHANGRLISILEGGYALKRLPDLIRNHVEILLGK